MTKTQELTIETLVKTGMDSFKFEEYTVYEYKMMRSCYSYVAWKRLVGKKQAIYFLYNEDENVYIGQTGVDGIENPYKRPIAHLTCERSPKKYDKIKIYHIPDNYDLNLIESMLIFKHKPKYNKHSSWGGTPISRPALLALTNNFKNK